MPVSAAGFCFVFVLFFSSCICFYLENAINVNIVIAAAAAIISEENRMQSCHARRTVQHLNNHPHGR